MSDELIRQIDAITDKNYEVIAKISGNHYDNGDRVIAQLAAMAAIDGTEGLLKKAESWRDWLTPPPARDAPNPPSGIL